MEPIMTLAETAGRVDESVDRTEISRVEQLAIPTRPGFVAWPIYGSTGDTVLPQLRPLAPLGIIYGHRARVDRQSDRVCPSCREVASVNADPRPSGDSWELEVTVGIIHAPPCSAAVLGEDDKRWFDARAFREVR